MSQVCPKLDTLSLRVRNPDAQRRFYCDVLGMHRRADGRVGYADLEALIDFKPATAAYEPQKSDLYWKIALSVPNIEMACKQLRTQGVTCSDPRQFRDVGYLAHVTDPEGFQIELIDHHFQGERPALDLNKDLLGGGAHLSLVTLRSADIQTLEPQLLAAGMTPLSVQPVETFGFTLYFYAFTVERPPRADLTAVENRTWVYQRPYTVLEIQHVHALEEETGQRSNAAGYNGLSVSDASAQVCIESLQFSSY